ncbi:MAG: TIGR02444 family protein [Glycocaulis sp.]|uniref:TIGR02444 family protein n=1 Tax=Glycocaulis sp. TaxID=1969725 RepID=UPI003F6E4737
MHGTHGQNLWDFSVALYAHEPVKRAALALQDAGLDVNIAFWLVWNTGRGRDPVPSLAEAVRIAGDWHALAVGPLRGVRDGLKAPRPPVPAEAAQALRQSVLGAELAAEHIAQTMLERVEAPELAASQGWSGRALAALEQYAAYKGVNAPAARFKEAVFSALEKG